jgi:hypothetical protein
VRAWFRRLSSTVEVQFSLRCAKGPRQPRVLVVTSYTSAPVCDARSGEGKRRRIRGEVEAHDERRTSGSRPKRCTFLTSEEGEAPHERYK